MKKNIRAVAIMIIFAFVVVGLYYKLNNQDQQDSETVDIPETKVEKILAKDLELDYPATVKTVMNFYSQLSKCFYDGKYTEDELPDLLEQYRLLLDDELIANNPEENQLESLNAEIESFGGKGSVIISYYWPADKSTEAEETESNDDADVTYYEKDGEKYASTIIAYTIKQGTTVVLQSQEKFVLRQDSEGRWKILGWVLVDRTE